MGICSVSAVCPGPGPTPAPLSSRPPSRWGLEQASFQEEIWGSEIEVEVLGLQQGRGPACSVSLLPRHPHGQGIQ